MSAKSLPTLIPHDYLCCPECGSFFSSESDSAWPVSARGYKTIRCALHSHGFSVRAGTADLLKPRYAEVLERLAQTRSAKPTDVEVATEWLAETLKLTPNTPAAGRDRALRRLLARVASLLHIARDMGLSDDDVCEVYAILAAQAMAAGYREHVADPAHASLEAVNFEKYEDILFRKVMESALQASDAVALIELGSGPGRLLHQYGSTISTTKGASEMYRRYEREMYRPDSLRHHERLRLLLGVDFSQDMLRSASRWLVQERLADLIESGRLAQVRATVRELPIDFDTPEWHGVTRVACILFQTLGNQLSRSLQIAMLESAKRCVGDSGVVFVSVFNAESFAKQGQQYYESIEGSVGGIWGLGERAFLSDRGVYSRWLFPAEMSDLMEAAGMHDAVVLDERELVSFPKLASYIDVASQESYKRRALVGLYSPSLKIKLT
jgi:hypothetical protein